MKYHRITESNNAKNGQKMTRLTTKNLPIWKLTSVQKSIVANWKERIIRFAIFFLPRANFTENVFFSNEFWIWSPENEK